MDNHYNKSYRALFFDEIEEYKEMISELSAHLSKDKKNIHALNNRAVANREIGNTEEAISDLKNVLNIGASSYVPYHNLGEIYEKKGDLEPALALYSKAIERYPNEVTSYRIRAYALFKAKRWAESIPDFNKSIELAPNWKQTYLDRAKAKEKSGDETGANKDRLLAKKC